eukprot:CAMPEP_0176489944 /NCGR_PEP_ID=MMETSP0200_2-20121128/7587_1 /TAXON_ID=947934 /ORGANISM="Chaetoceros sp., Strain GSL56" /LENGTH=118 /DNA_ID=CAMNT_0017887177 /DNA_START=333 /DNA_END=686 /DNA_ORIENTATION=-
MTLTARHHWCIGRIKQCFQDQEAIGEDVSMITEFMQEEQVLSKFNDLFAGKGGRNVLFVHYQKKQFQEENEYEDEEQQEEEEEEEEDKENLSTGNERLSLKKRGGTSKFLLVSHGDTI